MPTIHIGPDGSVTADLGQIKRVGILNIFNLKSYARSQVDDRIMHVIEFDDGGTCEITYLTDGKLEVFHGQHIQATLDDNGTVIIGQHGSN
jgi:hypothetical protein